MIGRLTGTIVDCRPGQALLDVGGVGYSVQIPVTVYYELSARQGQRVILHVHTHVREDALQLFGFLDAADRTLFEVLISISGVGPRLALTILSGIGSEELRLSVAAGDRERLQKIPGIGKKTAERLLLELRDKLRRTPAGAAPVGQGRAAASAEDSAARIHDLRGDAISALINLGYSQEASAQAIDRALARLGAGTSLQELLKGALGGLLR